MPDDLDLFSGKRVLIVEDEYFVAQDTSRALEKAGAIVVGPAASVDDGLRLVHRPEKIDAAILDINLDGDMVYPIADLLERMNIPFVFATGCYPSAVFEKYSGYVLCEKPAELAYIAKALFAARSDLH